MVDQHKHTVEKMLRKLKKRIDRLRDAEMQWQRLIQSGDPDAVVERVRVIADLNSTIYWYERLSFEHR